MAQIALTDSQLDQVTTQAHQVPRATPPDVSCAALLALLEGDRAASEYGGDAKPFAFIHAIMHRLGNGRGAGSFCIAAVSARSYS